MHTYILKNLFKMLETFSNEEIKKESLDALGDKSQTGISWQQNVCGSQGIM